MSGLLLKQFCETVFIDSIKVEGVFTSRIVSELGLFLACMLFSFYFSPLCDENMSNSVFNRDRCETVCCSRPLAADLHSSAVCVCVFVTSIAVISIQSEWEPSNRASASDS